MKDLCELKFFLGILKLIAELGLGGAKPASALLEHNQKLTCTDYDNFINNQRTDKDNTDTDHLLSDASQYQRLVGRLLYLTMTRTNIAFDVQTRKFVTRYLVKFGNALISWKSKKQDIVARSSAEAEFRSMASIVAELT
uniref:Uncharacterized mitochondrial protein AtMg00810-like n=1 Tax=Nicotiana tabacum TaxID=4097 RepID=A0A1S3YF25_TOBAC|nr:PREDICTED: uncharacterized mitochondrial protein AtMg00810-like [Nicotiana tabacum]